LRQPRDVSALVTARLVKPLGNPPANGIKFFATADILELTKDRNWLVRVTSTINLHWHNKNANKKIRLTISSPIGQSA
jgi:hypothetical protein